MSEYFSILTVHHRPSRKMWKKSIIKLLLHLCWYESTNLQKLFLHDFAILQGLHLQRRRVAFAKGTNTIRQDI